MSRLRDEIVPFHSITSSAIASTPESCWRAGRCDHAYPSAHQIGRQPRKSIVVPLRPMVFDRDVVALDMARFANASPKCGAEAQALRGRASIHETDHRHRRRLGAGDRRPCCRGAAGQRHEAASIYLTELHSDPAPPKERLG
jgi:hypothetical protein